MSIREYPSIFLHDLHYGWRQFRAAPTTAFIAIASLAIGIGANTTIFSVVHAVLLAPPAYKSPDQLVVLWESNQPNGIERTPVAPPTFLKWCNANHSFEDLQLVAPGSPVTVTGGLPERANIQYATPGLFRLLGVEPIVGHGFTQADLRNGDPLLVSYGYWQRHFGGKTGSIGQKIVVNGAVHSLAGGSSSSRFSDTLRTLLEVSDRWGSHRSHCPWTTWAI
jgi:putative ABC transport system permease protein